MVRIIKFRGYNLKNKQRLYGYYLVNRGKHYIVQDEVVEPFSESSDFEVDPESVGQYVGDYNGTHIFEGDEVVVESTRDEYMHYMGIVEYDVYDCRFVVKFNVHCGLDRVPITGYEQTCKPFNESGYTFFYKYKVIGNKYKQKMEGQQ